LSETGIQFKLLNSLHLAHSERGDYKEWRKVQFDKSTHSELDQAVCGRKREIPRQVEDGHNKYLQFIVQ
jgi:hypothetical protein